MGLPCQGRLVHRHSPTSLLMLTHIYTGDTGRAHHQNCPVFTPEWRHASHVLRQRSHRRSQAYSWRPYKPCTGRTICQLWRPDHGFHPATSRHLCCNRRTTTKPYPTPKAHPCDCAASQAAAQHRPPSTSDGATHSASKPSTKATPKPTIEGGSPRTQPTPQVPHALTCTGQPYSGDRRGRRLSFPRGT